MDRLYSGYSGNGVQENMQGSANILTGKVRTFGTKAKLTKFEGNVPWNPGPNKGYYFGAAT